MKGEGVSYITFWFLLWALHSRYPIANTFPWPSPTICIYIWCAFSKYFSRKIESLLKKVMDFCWAIGKYFWTYSSLLHLNIPIPPPASEPLIIIGYPNFWAYYTALSDFSIMGVAERVGTPAY